MYRYFFVFVLFTSQFWSFFAYQIPSPKLELLEQGFRVSIPDVAGVENVAFNIKLNQPFKRFEEGQYSERVLAPTNNRWAYENQRNLQDDDVVYLWINVQHNKMVYRTTSNPIFVKSIRGNVIPPKRQNTSETNKQGKEEVTDDNEEKKSNENTSDTNNTNENPNIDLKKEEERNTNTTNPDIEIKNKNDNCLPSITTYGKRQACKDQLIFEDSFDGVKLNSQLWKQEVRIAQDVLDYEFTLYDTNVRIKDGQVEIIPLLWNNDKPGTNIQHGRLNLGDRCTGYKNSELECKRVAHGIAATVLPPVISARMNTRQSFSFMYGRVEIRAKLPQGDWLLPLLLLEPLENFYGHDNYQSGQIRIAFARGNENLMSRNDDVIDGRRLYGGGIVTPNTLFREKTLRSTYRDVHFGEEFHNYTMIWNKQNFKFFIDGEEYGVVEGNFAETYAKDLGYSSAWKSGDSMAPFDKEFYITIGLAAGGHIDFPEGCISYYRPKPWENLSPSGALKFWEDRDNWKPTWKNSKLLVDYVRVYAI
ncbi:gram-negative bacteria-binding protein 1-like [Teleopsis dalmanni]|uniref:gram-negative bacteria-binding protein 1-like n=1 Tax=Teleopsis dalmanni TaxID=139649 RepID=UPI0018CE4EEB|nr:gram-negative bacteria-binding protein 1-like [Teleopsis dalmanni]